MRRDLDINQCVNNELLTFVINHLPSTLSNKYEKAIAAYIILCRTLKMDPDYVVYRDITRLSTLEEVTPTNNKVTGWHFALIYYKILRMLDLKPKLHETVDNEKYVTFKYKGISVTVSPFNIGYFEDHYSMNDFTNARYGFMLNGFEALPASSEFAEVSVAKRRTDEVFKGVYTKLGLNHEGHKIDEVLEKIYRREQQRSNKYDGARIARMFESINFLRFLKNEDVENAQIINKIIYSLFRDIYDERTEIITLFNECSGQVRLTQLVIIYDEDMQPYYYLFRNGKLVLITVMELTHYMIENGWYFNSPPDIDALGIQDDATINRLYKHQ